MITNAGAEHLEGFGSLEGVARAEGEMVAGLTAAATAVINADDEFAQLWRGSTPARVVTFGVRSAADFSASEVRTSVGAAGLQHALPARAPRRAAPPIELHLGGAHNVANALAAAAAAASAGATLEHIAAGLAAVRAVPGRLQFKQRHERRLAHRRFLQRQPELGARRDRGARLARRAQVAGARRHGRARRLRRARRTPRSASSPAPHGIERLYATGALMARAVDSFGAGAHWFADAPALTAPR